MKIKYEILDLTNNPNDLQAGDMVKLRKGLRIGQRYNRWTLYREMRYKGYHIILDKLNGLCNIFHIYGGNKTHLTVFGYQIHMLDLTCVKRPIKVERLN